MFYSKNNVDDILDVVPARLPQPISWTSASRSITTQHPENQWEFKKKKQCMCEIITHSCSIITY